MNNEHTYTSNCGAMNNDERLEDLQNVLEHIRDHFYSTEMTASKRLALGTRTRHIPDAVYAELEQPDRDTLLTFHRTSLPLVQYLLYKRESDRTNTNPSKARYYFQSLAEVKLESEKWNTVNNTNTTKMKEI